MILTIEEARAKATDLHKQYGVNAIEMRSCWNCNSAHEYLKDKTSSVICCFSCGHFFYNGVDITEEEDD